MHKERERPRLRYTDFFLRRPVSGNSFVFGPERLNTFDASLSLLLQLLSLRSEHNAQSMIRLAIQFAKRFARRLINV